MSKKIAKISIVIIIGALLLFIKTLAALALAANFSDVPETHPYTLAIQTLKDAGIISGYVDGTFKPDQKVTRAETTAIILKAAGITAAKTNAKLPFTDVVATDWFFPMIQKGVALQKLKGYEDKTFRPNNPVTLPESLALLLGFWNVSTKKITVDPLIYGGLEKEAWYAKYAQYAKDKNLIEPDAEGHVDAVNPITRGQLAEIIYRMRIAKETGAAFDITKNWITTEHIDNFWKLRHPSDWQVFKGTLNSVIWKRGDDHAFFTRIWPQTAHLSISVVENPENLSAVQYFARLKDSYKNRYKNTQPVFAETNISGKPALKIKIPEGRIIDMAVYLPNKKFLVFYGEYGNAAIGEFLQKQLEQIVLSYQYIEPPPIPPPPPLPPLEERMETLRENILIAGKWPVVAPLFPDKKLIHTDAIGVGTGPVDYYFSAEAATTIKLERNSGTVLNIKETETTAF